MGATGCTVAVAAVCLEGAWRAGCAHGCDAMIAGATGALRNVQQPPRRAERAGGGALRAELACAVVEVVRGAPSHSVASHLIPRWGSAQIGTRRACRCCQNKGTRYACHSSHAHRQAIQPNQPLVLLLFFVSARTNKRHHHLLFFFLILFVHGIPETSQESIGFVEDFLTF